MQTPTWHMRSSRSPCHNPKGKRTFWQFQFDRGWKRKQNRTRSRRPSCPSVCAPRPVRVSEGQIAGQIYCFLAFPEVQRARASAGEIRSVIFCDPRMDCYFGSLKSFAWIKKKGIAADDAARWNLFPPDFVGRRDFVPVLPVGSSPDPDSWFGPEV